MDTLDVAGFLCMATIAVGVGLIYIPAGVIVAGALGLLFVLRLAPDRADS